MMRRILHFAGRTLLLLPAVVGLYLLAAKSLAKVPANGNVAQPQQGIPIHTLSNGVHTELVLAVANAQHDRQILLDRNLTTKPDSLARSVAVGVPRRTSLRRR